MNFMALFELILIILYFSHFLACSWTFLCRIEKEFFDITETWIEVLKDKGRDI